MISIVVAMVAIVVVAALVLYYVAVPHRGAADASPGWLGRSMRRARGSLRTLDEDDDTGPPTDR